MKLENTKKKSTSHEDKESVYKQIAEKFGPEIKLMLTMKKGEEPTRYNFRAPGKIGRMAGILAAKISVVKTVSDVYRAAVYLGLSIIYHMLLQNPSEETVCFFEQCAEGDLIIERVNLIDRCLYLVAQHFAGYQGGIMDWDELQKKVKKMVDQLPKNLQKIAQNDINKVLNGVPVAQITSIKQVGRPVKEIEYYGNNS